MKSPETHTDHQARTDGSFPHRKTPSPGARLRERREAQKLSLESVAMQLHISAQIVRALEEDDAARLPPPVYVRGFLRNYARLLDMPESEVLGAYPAPEAAPRPVESVSVSLKTRRRTLLPMIIVPGALAALAFVAWQLAGDRLVPDGTGETPAAASSSTVSAPALPAAPPLPPEAPAAPPPVSAAPETPPAEAPSPLAPPADSAPVSSPPEPEPPRPSAVAEPAPPPANALVLRFTGESWVTVVDAAGKRLLYETGLPGTTRTVSGQPPFKVTLGRPGNVGLEFNGQAFPHRYTDKSGPVRLRIGG